MKKTAIALCTLPALAFGGTAMAKDMKGRFGVGGQLDDLFGAGVGAPTGLSMKYWVSDLGLQLLLGMEVTGDDDRTPDLIDESATELGLGLRLLYNFARANDTNMYAGAGIRLGLIDADATIIDVVLGVEHFFTDYFSVAGHVGLAVNILENQTNIVVGNSAFWGTSFHFYF